jgi:hypothetical protein
MKLYAVLDKKSGMLSSFHVEKNDAMASRGFADAVNQPNSPLGRYHEDFDLVILADVEEDSTASNIIEGYVRGFEVLMTATQVVALSAKSNQLSLLPEG